MRYLIGWLCSLLCATSFAVTDAAFTLSTNAFLDTGALPVLYTCDGKNIPPQLSWSNPPPQTQSYALIFADPDAPSGIYYHWILYNIPAKLTEIASLESISKEAMTGKNSANKIDYTGPCPPKGAAHTYVFTLFALNAQLDLPAGADIAKVQAAMQNHIIGKAELKAVYSRWLK
jgi:Raf kinase inhibitor-like YbhB/YbcL family protein